MNVNYPRLSHIDPSKTFTMAGTLISYLAILKVYL